MSNLARVMPEAINLYWCVEHWKPFLALTDEARAFANRHAQRVMYERRDFRQAVQRVMSRSTNNANAAAAMVLLEWNRAQKKSMCCILGERVMADLLRAARGYT